MLRAKLISSCDKCFPDNRITGFEEFNQSFVYENQRLSLQLALTDDDPAAPHRRFIGIEVTGDAAACVSMRTVDLIPSLMPVYPGKYDDFYLRTTPGLYPDLLSPLQMSGAVPCVNTQLRTVWIDIEMNGSGLLPGEHSVIFTLHDGESTLSLPFSLTLIPASLPHVDFKVTQWFHCDCLATYYNVEIFSERHWEIIENFARTASRNGINLLLTPLFTPPLDTHIGGERPTVQLAGVTLKEDGSYEFDFSLLDRWIEMCNRCGIEYFEIAHFFTQWGAAHAPKIMAHTPDGYRRIFGWDTDATSDEYTGFLRSFLGEFMAHMRGRGDDKRCLFHISDEPNINHIDQYLKAKSTVSDILDGYTVMDAISNVEYYLNGIVDTPVPCNTHIDPFIKAYAERGVRGLWTYYCCGQAIGVSNRFFAMPGARTRFIGVQFYKYNLVGFLQWGYNFYYNQGSYDPINPYVDSTGNYFFPSGDGYSVYPAADGTALESMRINQFREGLDDMRALRLLESLTGRENAIAAVEEITGEVVFDRCVCDSPTMMRLRRAIDARVYEALNVRS